MECWKIWMTEAEVRDRKQTGKVLPNMKNEMKNDEKEKPDAFTDNPTTPPVSALYPSLNGGVRGKEDWVPTYMAPPVLPPQQQQLLQFLPPSYPGQQPILNPHNPFHEQPQNMPKPELSTPSAPQTEDEKLTSASGGRLAQSTPPGSPDTSSSDEDNKPNKSSFESLLGKTLSEIVSPTPRETPRRSERQRTLTSHFQAPMVEYPADANGTPVLIYRPADDEMKTVAKDWPPMEKGGEELAKSLLLFCKTWRPTAAELRKLLLVHMGPQHYAKIQATVETDGFEALAAKLVPWTEAGDWEIWVTAICSKLRESFAVKVDYGRLRDCKQQDHESVSDYFHRLLDVCIRHSGQVKPNVWEGVETPFENIMKTAFGEGLHKPILTQVRSTLVGGRAENRLQELLKHAKHGEQREKEKRDKTARHLDTATLNAQLAPAHLDSRPFRGQGRGRGRGRGQGRGRRYSRTYDPTKCFNCEKHGHWAKDCPETPREGDGGNRRGGWQDNERVPYASD
ncbi:uncharacterized protein LOC132982359 [Labrus mixtus]|uniref:uncharacterized protein LOC132982359 n=1 Tax=Labrus mixtus TaxID=508554 RepID=UPI0029C0F124|nr:uncharacterized protein LOC132982359 [Labrus mixtus]